MIRAALKRGVELALVGSGADNHLRRRLRGRCLVLAYHNVVPPGEGPWGERAIHVSWARFARHLEVLQETCQILALSDLLEADGRVDRPPRVAITFDDAYGGTVAALRGMLVPLQVPATVFAPPGLLGSDGFWWDRLAEGRGGDLPGSLRDHCLRALRGRQDRVISWAKENGLPLPEAPGYARPVDEQELLEVVRSHGIGVESHTWSHANLTALSERDRLDEFTRARVWIKERGLGPADAVAYPFGLASKAVSVAASRSGHHNGFMVKGGWMPGAVDTVPCFRLPRLSVPAGLSARGLRIRLAGLWTS